MLAYNIPGVTNLVLTRQQIVGIYNGSINNWNDTTFAEHNPGVQLPNATIVPMARLGSTGSTEIFTRALSSFSDLWAAQYGVFSERTGWNASVVTQFTQRTSGMADTIRHEPYHIGYLTPVSAVQVNLSYASIINRRGRVTVADTTSVQAAMDERDLNMTSRLTSNLVDCEDEQTYPIAGYTYFIVPMTQEGNCSVAVGVTLEDWSVPVCPPRGDLSRSNGSKLVSACGPQGGLCDEFWQLFGGSGTRSLHRMVLDERSG